MNLPVRRAAASSPEGELSPPPYLASEIERVPLSELRPYDRDLRVHSQKQIAKLAGLIESAGFLVPIIVDHGDVIIAGHARYLAAQALGLKFAPVIRASHLTSEQVKAFRVADNRIGELSSWNERSLALELKELRDIEIRDPSIQLLVVHEQGEIDANIESLDDAEDPADAPVSMEQGPATTVVGDIIRLGRHRLLCGSALDEASYRVLLGEIRARTVATDPPYNVRISGHVSGLGKVRHREFAMASGEMNEAEFIAFLSNYMRHATAYSPPGSLHYAFMDGAHLFELLTAARETGLSLKTICTWGKTNASMGSLYRQQTEFCPVFKNGGDNVPHVNNVQLGKWGRWRSTLWSYPGCNTFRTGRADDLQNHPTTKARAMIADIIKDSSRAGDAILDPFCGSGTTILAAEGTGRVGYGIELDPLYCDLIVRRFEKLTGETAIYEATGLSASETRRLRLNGVGSPRHSAPLLLEDKRTNDQEAADVE